MDEKKWFFISLEINTTYELARVIASNKPFCDL
jgi:hypothetical protein